MTEQPNQSESASFRFVRHVDAKEEILTWPDGGHAARKSLAESLNAKNVSFLLGAGCSSAWKDDVEVGIPTMGPLSRDFVQKREEDVKGFPTKAEREFLTDVFGIDLGTDEYARNLERLMEVLFSLRFILEKSAAEDAEARLDVINSLIEKVQTYLWMKCTQGAFSKGDETVLDVYTTFYRKLVLRDRSLPRPWVFTTNYDLFNETAMDRLGIPFFNGFSGVVERRFNPSTFRYALAEQLDLTSRKWTAVDAFVYLCKLHGSVSWTEDGEDGNRLFPIREVISDASLDHVMIYPTPAKQNSALASPYADLIREFQSRVVREQSVLFTMGYAFGDEHLNNIIYQALTIPTFRLVIFADPDSDGEIAKLRSLNDPRIWIIGGNGPEGDTKAHYFNTIVAEFMPQRPSERIDDAVKKVIQTMSPKPEPDE
ncbi:MAG: hypothetical protein VR74_07950 [Hyphomonas sp. BRH_c22]|uniref:SIR2 family protein n=1 Tax=Hyphomonas sp. BRH_c22 TaxID=1629710 RepID=UPI0005F0CB10|nr:SIR2 family protein [Hyphomonas sp. BRH_c22]KJS37657.1 MAG: hypothetical protein VR74_07950 [Hyphomonas sp. BRH_c22]